MCIHLIASKANSFDGSLVSKKTMKGACENVRIMTKIWLKVKIKRNKGQKLLHEINFLACTRDWSSAEKTAGEKHYA